LNTVTFDLYVYDQPNNLSQQLSYL